MTQSTPRSWLIAILLITSHFGYALSNTSSKSSQNTFVLPEGIIHLTNLNYEHYFAEHKYIIAYIDKSGLKGECKKCQKAVDLLKAAAATVPSRFEIKLAFISRKTDSALLNRLRIFENQMFAYIANDRAVPYRDNNWSVKTFGRWIRERIIKPSTPYMYETDFENHEKAHPRIVSYVGKRSKYYNIFRYIASSYEDIKFLHSFSTPVLDRRNRTVEFTKHPEKTSFTLHVPFTSTQLNTLINNHNNVQRILDGPTVSRIMTKEDVTLLLIHTDPSSPEVTQFIRTGNKHFEEAVFIATPLVEGKFMVKIVRWLGVGPKQGKDYPCLRLIARLGGRMVKYEFQGKITEQNILKFLTDYKEGRLKNYYISEDVPPTENDRAVQRVVGKNFESVVGNKLKDVVVFFHSVWCLECKEVTPTYETLAGIFSGYRDIQFISVDSYNNEGDRIPDGAFGDPIIRIYKADDKKRPLTYKGNWKMSDLQAWLEQALGVKVDL